MSSGDSHPARLVPEREARLAARDAAIARGMADADTGRTSSTEDVFNRLEAKYEAMPNAETRAAMAEAEAILAARRATT